MSTTPTTTLQAVNDMLTAIGTAPVNTLDAPGNSDVSIAKDVLDSTSREVQTRGWWFNTTTYESFAPSNNTITVPLNVTSVRPSRGTNSNPPEPKAFVLREGKLFNPLTNSFNFTTSVRADTVRLIDFEYMPESSRRYVTVRASRIFQTKVLGDESLGVYNEAHEQESYQILEGDQAASNPHSDMFMQRVKRMGRMTRPDPVTSGEARGDGRRRR